MKDKKLRIKKRYIFSFLLFFSIGMLLGGFGTYKTLGVKSDNTVKKNVAKVKDTKEAKDEDITKNPDYNDLINRLYSFLGKDNVFYNSTGLTFETFSNVDKLRVMYKYMINNKLYEEEDFSPVYFGALTCRNNFNLDVVVGDNGVLSNGSKCTVYKISKESFINSYNSIFDDTNIETGDFKPLANKSCILDEDYYYCGNVNNGSGVTGSLDTRFEIVKVIKTKDTIEIYDKGYLIDTRSNIVNSEDGHDNYYLHTADSNSYYYELKSSDNVTFKHVFKLFNNSDYKYSSTTVVEK